MAIEGIPGPSLGHYCGAQPHLIGGAYPTLKPNAYIPLSSLRGTWSITSYIADPKATFALDGVVFGRQLAVMGACLKVR
jgi:hypothetical protein